MLTTTLKTLAAAALIAAPVALWGSSAIADTARVNGIDFYYEVHGDGPPLVLLHGAYMAIPSNWDALIPTLEKTNKVIAIELQGHGRTGDADRPITYEGMADDTVALLQSIGVGKSSFFGYSMGAGVAIQVALRHPEAVDRLIAASGSLTSKALPDGFDEMAKTITPAMFAGTPYEAEYKRLAPHPENFPQLVEKLKQLDLTPFDWSEADEAEYKRLAPHPENFPQLVEKLKQLDLTPFDWSEADWAKVPAPTLLIFGDADVIKLDHALKMFTLQGGKPNGDMNGLPKVQLAVLPGTPHTGVVTGRNAEYLKIMVPAFLEQALPVPPPTFN